MAVDDAIIFQLRKLHLN